MKRTSHVASLAALAILATVGLGLTAGCSSCAGDVTGEGEGEGDAGEGEGDAGEGEGDAGEGEGDAGEGEGDAGEGEGDAGEGEGEGEGDVACAAPTVIQAGFTTGSTAGGTTELVGTNCLVSDAGKETVFQFTPAHDGELTITLTSSTDLGFYVRTTCADDTSAVADADGQDCIDNEDETVSETGTFVVTQGVPLFLVVDTFVPQGGSSDGGAFTLNLDFTASNCGDGQVTLPEQCDGTNLNNEECGNEIPGTAGTLTCTSSCTFDTSACASVCSMPNRVSVGPNPGDTSLGNKALTSNCVPFNGGKEEIFTFTPAVTGFVRFTLASATDQTIFARSTCDDDTSELGCADFNGANEGEVLTLATTADTPITVVVQAFRDAENGPYTLTIENAALTETEPNDTPPAADTVDAFVDGYTGFVSTVDDRDCVSIAAALGQVITATVTDSGDGRCATGAMDSNITIFDVDGTTSLATNDDISNQNNNLCSSTATPALAAAGTYFVCVETSPMPQNFAALFEYGLTIALTGP